MRAASRSGAGGVHGLVELGGEAALEAQFATVLVLSAGATAGMLAMISHGALAASFTVSGQQFKVSADQLVATGFVQYGTVDARVEPGSNPPSQQPEPVAVSAMRQATLTNLCQSVVTDLGDFGALTLTIKAGTGQNPVTATNMVVDMSQLDGNAVFESHRDRPRRQHAGQGTDQRPERDRAAPRGLLQPAGRPGHHHRPQAGGLGHHGRPVQPHQPLAAPELGPGRVLLTRRRRPSREIEMTRSGTPAAWRTARYAGVALLVAAGTVALPAARALAAEGTTVTPAGHAYTATLVPGTTAVFVVGSTTVTCNQSSNTGAVPAEPANSSADGPVVSELTPATFTNNGGACPTNVLFTTARTVSNSANGPWTIAMQYDPAGSTGTMTIPRAGVVTTISGLASCTVTVAPDGPASFSGPLRPGTEAGPPVLDFSAGVTLPIRVTGGLTCPTGATTATFKAGYAVTDTTDPARQITVSPTASTPTDPTPTDPTPTDPPTDPTPTDPTPTDPPSDPPTDPPSDPVPTDPPSDPVPPAPSGTPVLTSRLRPAPARRPPARRPPGRGTAPPRGRSAPAADPAVPRSVHSAT